MLVIPYIYIYMHHGLTRFKIYFLMLVENANLRMNEQMLAMHFSICWQYSLLFCLSNRINYHFPKYYMCPPKTAKPWHPLFPHEQSGIAACFFLYYTTNSISTINSTERDSIKKKIERAKSEIIRECDHIKEHNSRKYNKKKSKD